MGFQKMNPEEFVILAEILGNLASLELPYNLQNTVGNWLQLLGQVLITFNGQQQYFEQGPGKIFSEQNYNADNAACPQNQSVSRQEISELFSRFDDLQQEIRNMKKRLKQLESKR